MAQQQSMFGPTPQELQQMFMQQQQEQDMNQAMKWGQGSLGQQISTAGFMGGTMVGRGLQGLGQAAGVLPEDPRIVEARRLMEIKKELMEANIDPSDIDTFYPEMIKKLNAGGFIDQANAAMRQYTQAQAAQGNLEARKAEIEVKRLNADKAKKEAAFPGYRILNGLTKAVTEYPVNAPVVAAFEQSITKEKPTGDLTILKELQTPEKDAPKPIMFTATNEPVFADSRGTYMFKRVPNPENKNGGMVSMKVYGDYAGRPPTTPTTTVTVGGNEVDKLEYTARLEALKPALKANVEQASLASESIPRMENLITQVQNNEIYSGFGADFQVNAANFIKTMSGLDIAPGKITSSQIVDSLVGPEILAAMKQLGGQDSNEELRKITSMQPNRVMTKDALMHTATVLKQSASRALLKNQNYMDFVRNGGKVVEFDFAKGFMPGQENPIEKFPIPVWDTSTMQSYPDKKSAEAARKDASLKGMTDAEIARRLAETEKKK